VTNRKKWGGEHKTSTEKETFYSRNGGERKKGDVEGGRLQKKEESEDEATKDPSQGTLVKEKRNDQCEFCICKWGAGEEGALEAKPSIKKNREKPNRNRTIFSPASTESSRAQKNVVEKKREGPDPR